MTFFVVSSQPSRMARRLYSSLGIAEESGGRDSGPSARRFFKQRVFGWNRWPKGDDGSGQCSKLSKTSSSSSSYLQQLMLLLGGTHRRLGKPPILWICGVAAVTPGWVVIINEWVAGQGHKGVFFALGRFLGVSPGEAVPTIHTSTKT